MAYGVPYGTGEYRRFFEIKCKRDIIVFGRWNKCFSFFKLIMKTADVNIK